MSIKVDTYTKTGAKKSTKSTLPAEFEGKVNEDLLAQALRVYEWQMHTGGSYAKTRADVVASTRKIYRQKGTGRARHGAISAPIFVGGGKAHGPTGIRRSLSLPKSMKAKARTSAFVKKLSEKDLAVAEVAGINKTKDAAALLAKLGEGKKKFTVALSNDNKEVKKVFRNIKNVKVVSFKNLNAYNILYGGFLVIDADSFTTKKESTVKKTKKGAKS